MNDEARVTAPFQATITLDVWAWERHRAEAILAQILDALDKTRTEVNLKAMEASMLSLGVSNMNGISLSLGCVTILCIPSLPIKPLPIWS